MAFGISGPTFHKHYFSLVDGLRSSARDALDAEYAMRIWTEVQAGNVGAMRLWREVIARNDMMRAEAAMAEQPADKPAGEKLGKKAIDEQRAMDADADLTAERAGGGRVGKTLPLSRPGPLGQSDFFPREIGGIFFISLQMLPLGSIQESCPRQVRATCPKVATGACDE